ncbi:hypothetical protein O3M35_009500 [Rhynocoris fuscipes]|uniref:Uncharacterized protein n=1 Tax=Rhynocoris fuscipes TaxID=488301 RepID=A0AAW1D621_9HEMI
MVSLTRCKLLVLLIQRGCGSGGKRRMTAPVPIRLARVAGYQGRYNDIVYTPPWSATGDINALQHSSQVVVFFGGDVQDFSENMEAHRDNKRYARWNLENTASILQAQFENHHIVVVRPSRMEFKMFSCYDNFVPCNNTGAPDHTPMHFALLHLERLLQNISNRLIERKQQVENSGQQNNSANNSTNENDGERIGSTSLESGTSESSVCRLDKCDSLTLIGFSKGCVVLNQFVYEFHYLKTLTPDDQSLSEIVNRISDIYWLDGGHSGGKNTWVTSRSLLETLTRLGIRVHVHVTPFQINDDRRPWIRKEERSFTEWLKRLGAPLSRHVHFDSLPPSLATHLELIAAFKQPASTVVTSTDDEMSQ